jgi:hypothetical protein
MTSRTGGSIFPSGRSVQDAMIASYAPRIRSVPYTSSVAKAASRRSKSGYCCWALRSSDGRTRLAYASRSSTARSASNATRRAGSVLGLRYGRFFGAGVLI